MVLGAEVPKFNIFATLATLTWAEVLVHSRSDYTKQSIDIRVSERGNCCPCSSKCLASGVHEYIYGLVSGVILNHGFPYNLI